MNETPQTKEDELELLETPAVEDPTERTKIERDQYARTLIQIRNLLGITDPEMWTQDVIQALQVENDNLKKEIARLQKGAEQVGEYADPRAVAANADAWENPPTENVNVSEAELPETDKED